MDIDIFRYIANQDPAWDWRNFDLEKDIDRALLHGKEIHAVNPDLAKFKARGGKLLMYHGWSDGGSDGSILEEDGATRERRDQLTHPEYHKPELLANAPNQLWSWDITKLRGPAKWTYFYLYVILDVFSRYIVGWMVAPRESAELARKLIEETCEKQKIEPGQLSLHADRGFGDAVQTGGVTTGRSERDQDPQPAVYLERQSVLGEPVPHHEIPPRVSRYFLKSVSPRFLHPENPKDIRYWLNYESVRRSGVKAYSVAWGDV